MAENIDSILQPLRIPAGWSVDYNILTHFDPSPETAKYFYGEWHFAASHHRSSLGVEVTFRPEGDPSGTFHIHYYRIVGSRGDQSKSDVTLTSHSTPSRREAVAALEHLMSSGTLSSA